MAKRGYKLQEFMAHSGNVNCLRIGRKNFRHFLTGGDDNKVNLWSIGKPTCSTSLSGHSSPVESVAFDSAEVLVLAGSSSGAIKLWDLEETKMVRSLTGHRSYCTALEFHPFGEFFASGSMDTNLKVWDIRKKGCIHTYKGHTRGISTIRFSPDGRWVVSGGFDNIVKVWDLTAGKLLHDFKFHEGHVRSIEFHPLEFMLATGSADRTVKFWDLETFEMIGSTRRETAGVRSVTFHPDGRTLFCGLDDGLKVYGWEPVVCHDSVDMGWSTLGDLCIHDGKLLGCAYYENSVGVWAADVSKIAPYSSGEVAKRNGSAEIVVDVRESPLERVSSQNRRSLLPDDDSKDIKNIYVDTAGANCITLKKGSISSSDSVYLETKEMNDTHNQKKGSFLGSGTNTSGQSHNRSLVAPGVVPRDIPDAKELVETRRESFPSSRASMAIPLKPSHVRKQSSGKFDMDRMSTALESKVSKDENPAVPKAEDTIFSREPDVNNNSKKASKETQSDIKDVNKKSEKATLVSHSLNQENSDVAAESKIGVTAVKVVNGVAVVRGRTRSLVERFEKRETLSGDDVHTDKNTVTVCQTPKASTIHPPDVATQKDRLEPKISSLHTPNTATETLIQETKSSPLHTSDTMIPKPTQVSKISPFHTYDTAIQTVIQEPKQSNLPSPRMPTPDAVTRLPKLSDSEDHTPDMVAHLISSDSETSPRKTLNIPTRMAIQAQKTACLRAPNIGTPAVIQESKQSNLPSPRMATPAAAIQQRKLSDSEDHTPDMFPHLISSDPETSPRKTLSIPTRMRIQAQKTARLRTPNTAAPAVTRTPKFSPLHTQKLNIAAANRGSKLSSSRTTYGTTPAITRVPRTSPLQNNDQLVVEPQEPDTNASNIIENLMDSHDGVLSTLRSRLTKLQVISHFWGRNDVKGAINATRKLPDYSVQADMVSILVGRMDIITLDLFLCLLPVLLGLLDSEVERHVIVSLEMLLKLVAVFGSVVHATVSAPRTIGVDLHAEERLECCKECFAHLQNVRKILPTLIRRGGVVAKSALELNLVLQEP